MRLLIFLLLALPFLSAGQIPENYDEIRDRWDVVLPPEAYLPETPTVYTLATGNWGPAAMGIEALYDRIARAATRPVVVFVFDTGADFDNESLNKVEWLDLARSFTGEPTLIDKHGHSTHCAGIIGAIHPTIPLGAARMLGEKGLLRIVPIKVLNDSGGGSYTWIQQGLNYAIGEARKLQEEGNFVIFSYSLGGSSKSQEIDEALKQAWEEGVLTVAAAGNTGREGIQFPGSSGWTLSTAALAQTESGGVDRASYSTYGAEQFQAAPGTAVLSTWKGNALATLSGTSMATPHMAGVFAILASVFPDATNDQLADHFKRYAVDLGDTGWDKLYGYGWADIAPLLDNKPTAPADPDPDPPAPDPPAPDKAYVSSLDFDFHIVWKAQDHSSYQGANIEYTVSFEGNQGFEEEYAKVANALEQFHSGRLFILLKGSDLKDAAFYTAYFLEMLAPQYYGVSIDVTKITAKTLDSSVELIDPITKKSTKKIEVSYQDGGALFLNTGAFTYTRW